MSAALTIPAPGSPAEAVTMLAEAEAWVETAAPACRRVEARTREGRTVDDVLRDLRGLRADVAEVPRG